MGRHYAGRPGAPVSRGLLRKIPAEVQFLSCEPLLADLGTLDLTGIDWVIVGRRERAAWASDASVVGGPESSLSVKTRAWRSISSSGASGAGGASVTLRWKAAEEGRAMDESGGRV